MRPRAVAAVVVAVVQQCWQEGQWADTRRFSIPLGVPGIPFRGGRKFPAPSRHDALRMQMADWSTQDPSLRSHATRVEALLQCLELQPRQRQRRDGWESRKKRAVAATETAAQQPKPPPADPRDVVVID